MSDLQNLRDYIDGGTDPVKLVKYCRDNSETLNAYIELLAAAFCYEYDVDPANAYISTDKDTGEVWIAEKSDEVPGLWIPGPTMVGPNRAWSSGSGTLPWAYNSGISRKVPKTD